MSTNPRDEIADHYARRGAEQDHVYEKPERQGDLARLKSDLPALLRGHRVLEVACGAGYWTQFIAASAESVTATDVNPGLLAIARRRLADRANAQLAIANAYELDGLRQEYTVAFAGFWWSHIPRARIAGFLDVLHARLTPSSLVVFVDNRYVEGSSTPILRTDAEGNTYQCRELSDGSRFELLKNFVDTEGFAQAVGSRGEQVSFVPLTYYWYGTYLTASSA